MKTKITLSNSFHSTTVNLEVELEPTGNREEREGFLSAAQIKRAERALCGIGSCTCGRVAGIRGKQWLGRMQMFLSETTTGGACVTVG